MRDYFCYTIHYIYTMNKLKAKLVEIIQENELMELEFIIFPFYM